MPGFFDGVTAVLSRPFRPRPGQVLHLINQARLALHLPPLDRLPPGRPLQATSCPIARSLNAMVGVDGICFDTPDAARRVAEAWEVSVQQRPDAYVVPLPRLLRRFVQHVDLGAYPSLTNHPEPEGHSVSGS